MTTIQKVTILNSRDVLNIALQTFTETFIEHNTSENLELYLNQHLTFSSIQKQISNPDSVFYLAIQNTQIVGFLKLNFGSAQTELQDDLALEIERIYVLKSHHGQKIGHLLMNKAIEVAQKSKLSYIWLGVWDNNKIGIDFYTKHGFFIFDTHAFAIGNDIQNDYLMKLNI